MYVSKNDLHLFVHSVPQDQVATWYESFDSDWDSLVSGLYEKVATKCP